MPGKRSPILPFLLFFLFAGLMITEALQAQGASARTSEMAPAVKEEPPLIRFQHGLLTVDVTGLPLADALEEIARQAAIRIHWDHPLQGNLSISLVNLPLDEAVRRILRTEDYVFVYSEKGKDGSKPLSLSEVQIYIWDKKGMSPSDQPSARSLDREQVDAAETQSQLEALITQALHDEDSFVRKEAVKSLGATKDIRAMKALSRALGDDDADVREEAVLVLAETGGKQALESLVRVLREDTNEYVRGRAADALARLGQEIAVGVLTESLQDKSPWVRQRAVEALAEIGGEQAFPPLTAVLQGDEQADIRKEAAYALKGLSEWESVQASLSQAAMEDEDGSVRDTAGDLLNGMKRSSGLLPES